MTTTTSGIDRGWNAKHRLIPVYFLAMGRLRGFDENAFVDTARELFWSDGYSETSIEKIAVATGVGNGSIYAAFGSKKDLYLAALRRYCENLRSTVAEAMSGCTGDIRTSLRTYLELIICDCVNQPGRRGCLMLNSIALVDRLPEIRPIIVATNSELEAAVTQRLDRDVASLGGQQHVGVDTAVLSAHFVALSQGLIQRSRLGDDPGVLRAIADGAVRQLAVTAGSVDA